MAKIKLMTDSASDIPKEHEADYQIEILGFPLIIGDKTYFERDDFTLGEFYKRLYTEPKIPSHSQITQIIFEEKFEEIANQGYSDLIYVAINSQGSNTFNAANMAKEAFYQNHPDRADFHIHILDAKTYSYAYGYAVVEAARKIENGATIKEVLAYLEDWYSSVEIYATAYTLQFAKKSGRVSSTAAFVGELLGFKPIITFINGENATAGKVRGDKAVVPALIKMAQEHRIPQTPYLVLIGDNEEEAQKLIKEAEKAFGYPPEEVCPIGATIAINIGPNLVGLVIKGKNKN